MRKGERRWTSLGSGLTRAGPWCTPRWGRSRTGSSAPSGCDLDRLFAQIQREKGRLDIVFANAGVAKYAPLGTITEEFYDSIFDGNVKGLLFTVQKALSLL